MDASQFYRVIYPLLALEYDLLGLACTIFRIPLKYLSELGDKTATSIWERYHAIPGSDGSNLATMGAKLKKLVEDIEHTEGHAPTTWTEEIRVLGRRFIRDRIAIATAKGVPHDWCNSLALPILALLSDEGPMYAIRTRTFPPSTSIQVALYTLKDHAHDIPLPNLSLLKVTLPGVTNEAQFSSLSLYAQSRFVQDSTGYMQLGLGLLRLGNHSCRPNMYDSSGFQENTSAAVVHVSSRKVISAGDELVWYYQEDYFNVGNYYCCCKERCQARSKPLSDIIAKLQDHI